MYHNYHKEVMSSQSEYSSEEQGTTTHQQLGSPLTLVSAATTTVSGGVTGITVTEGGFGYNDVTVEIIADLPTV